MAMKTKTTKPFKPIRSLRHWWKRYVWPVVRHLVIPVICVLALFAGMAAGYTILGKRPFSDVWELETWKHMFDLIFSKT